MSDDEPKPPFDPWAQKPKVGAPSTYTKEVGDELCRRLRSGRSLRSICEDEDMPERSTVWGWRDIHPEFSAQYERARVDQADGNADDVEHVGLLVAQGKIDPHAGRVAVDALKWAAGQKNPKRYGKVVAHKHGGDEGGAPIPVRMEGLSDAQLAALAGRLDAFADGRGGESASGEGQGNPGAAEEGADG